MAFFLPFSYFRYVVYTSTSHQRCYREYNISPFFFYLLWFCCFLQKENIYFSLFVLVSLNAYMVVLCVYKVVYTQWVKKLGSSTPIERRQLGTSSKTGIYFQIQTLAIIKVLFCVGVCSVELFSFASIARLFSRLFWLHIFWVNRLFFRYFEYQKICKYLIFFLFILLINQSE